MLVLSLSGAVLVARRAGGWQHWFARLRGPLSGRLHVEIARLAVAGLLLSSATALWMTASTFDLMPDGAVSPVMQTEASGQTGALPAAMEALRQVPVSELRSLSFADQGDPTDVFTLKTDRGTGYIDQGTGTLLGWSDLTGWQRVSETVYMLHTGRGASVLGLALGLMALGVPAMAITGVVLWFAGRRGRPRIRGNVSAGRAETVILVGSEGGSTWGFAATLHAALSDAGQAVHAAPMSAFDPARYGQAQRILILSATYGDGDAPASAKGFLDRLSSLSAAPAIPLAVLGFGDSSFPAYCAFAQAVTETAQAAGWKMLVPFDTVDRQSPQAFSRWGGRLALRWASTSNSRIRPSNRWSFLSRLCRAVIMAPKRRRLRQSCVSLCLNFHSGSGGSVADWAAMWLAISSVLFRLDRPFPGFTRWLPGTATALSRSS